MNDKFLYPITIIISYLLCMGKHLTKIRPLKFIIVFTLNIKDFSVFVSFEFIGNICSSFQCSWHSSDLVNKITGGLLILSGGNF